MNDDDIMKMDVFTLAGYALRKLIADGDTTETVSALLRIRELTRADSAAHQGRSPEERNICGGVRL